MSAELDAVGRRYLAHLTDADRRLLARAVPPAAADITARPAVLPDLLARDAVYAELFPAAGTAPADRPLIGVSPFLAFAVAVHRTARDLAGTSYQPAYVSPRRRLPIFDTPELAGFLAEPRHRLFLAELLASYARVASGTYPVRTAHGPRRRRFSDLDPVALAGLLDAVPAAERPGILRRLGDLSLFLSGVFPDHVPQVFGRFGPARLLRLLDLPDRPERPALELLEWLGARWYRQAARGAAAATAESRLIEAVAERFAQARRVLNLVADRYLFPAGLPWFDAP